MFIGQTKDSEKDYRSNEGFRKGLSIKQRIQKKFIGRTKDSEKVYRSDKGMGRGKIGPM